MVLCSVISEKFPTWNCLEGQFMNQTLKLFPLFNSHAQSPAVFFSPYFETQIFSMLLKYAFLVFLPSPPPHSPVRPAHVLDLLSVWASEFETNQAPLYLKQKRVINHVWAQVAFWCPLLSLVKLIAFHLVLEPWSGTRMRDWMKPHLEPWTWHFAWFKWHFNGKRRNQPSVLFLTSLPSVLWHATSVLWVNNTLRCLCSIHKLFIEVLSW